MYTGSAANATSHAAALAQMVELTGTDAVSVVTPSLIMQCQDELHGDYRTIAAATKEPVLLTCNLRQLESIFPSIWRPDLHNRTILW